MPELLRITYVRSAIGCSYRQKKVIRALGLRRLNYSRVLPDTPEIRGMINKVIHLLEVEPEKEPMEMSVAPEAVTSEEQKQETTLPENDREKSKTDVTEEVADE